MKQIRKIAQNPFVIFPLIGCFAFVSCKKDIVSNNGTNSGNSAIVMKSNNQFSGQEFYEGIFLKKGQVANQISMFNGKSTLESLDITPAEMIEINAGIDLITAEVQSLNPTYFEDLRSAIYADDHVIQAYYIGG